MAQTTSVLWSVGQGLGEEAKEQARQNIGAAAEQTVNDHTTEIDKIKEDVKGIEASLLNKKDKQQLKSFKGSSKQTIKNISQTENGELSVEFEVIDFPDFKLPSDIVRDSNYVHIDGATEVPLKDGITSVGVSTKYAREDHIHPTDTSREAIANKTTVILGTSNDKYPTDEAVAKFVNSSIATNTANYISNNGVPFISVEQLNAYTGTVTNNDYAFVTGIDSEGNTYYDRYKATVNDSSIIWALEYRLNNSTFTEAQWTAINSGITSALVANIHEHSNKAVLDGITSSDVANWNSKMDKQTVGRATEPVYLENGIAKIATGVATKTDLTNLTEVVNGHTTEIGQITESVEGVKSDLTDLTSTVYVHDSQIYQLEADVEDIELALTIKKDMQDPLNFSGNNKQTVTNITQNANGELTVEFADIDLPQEVPNVEITSEDNSIQVTKTTDVGTNTKKFDLSVKVDDPLEYGQFRANNVTSQAQLNKVKGNLELNNYAIKLKKGNSYHFTVRGSYVANSAVNTSTTIDYIEPISFNNISVNVDNTITDEQFFEISYDVYKLSSDKNYNVAFSSISGGKVSELWVEVHNLNGISVNGQGGGSGTTYSAGNGIVLTNDTISVNTNIIATMEYVDNMLGNVENLLSEL